MPRRVLGFLMLTLLSACSPVTVLNALAPRAGITGTRNVRYAPGDRHELDIYSPEGGRSRPGRRVRLWWRLEGRQQERHIVSSRRRWQRMAS